MLGPLCVLAMPAIAPIWLVPPVSGVELVWRGLVKS
jgi:hypothetical protein